MMNWPPLPSEEALQEKSRHDFIFFVVDVINSSRLFDKSLYDPELLQHDEILNQVHNHVIESFDLQRDPGYVWNWAGDGGVLAFPATKPGTIDKVLECAMKVASLQSTECSVCGPFDIQVRMVVHQGQAYYHPNKALCRSGALNLAAKIRLPGQRTSLTITDEIYNNILGPAIKLEFRPIVHREDNVFLHGHVQLMAAGFESEIARISLSSRKPRPAPAQAAHLSYRLGVLRFSERRREDAIAAFRKSIELLEHIASKHRYFYWTLSEFYGLWLRLATEATEELLQLAYRKDPLELLRSEQFKNFCGTHETPHAWKLLIVMELIIAQLDVLASNPVNNPVGLTSLEICLLLERVGYPRRWFGPAVHKRLARIKADMQADEEGAVDEGCSLCTAVAASCLILNDDDEEARKLLTWLRSRHDANYCWRRIDKFARVPKDNHAVNYAAAVLQSFVDSRSPDDDWHVDKIIDLFLGSPARDAAQFPESWTRYLTPSIYDFSTYVLPTLARYRIVNENSDDPNPKYEGVIRHALQVLASRLRSDAVSAGLEVGRTYAARENVGALALGQLIENFPDADDIIAYNLRRVADFVQDDIMAMIRTGTIDSSLDRMRKMLDGWLLLIEAALYRRRRGWSIPAFVTETLGIGPS